MLLLQNRRTLIRLLAFGLTVCLRRSRDQSLLDLLRALPPRQPAILTIIVSNIARVLLHHLSDLVVRRPERARLESQCSRRVTHPGRCRCKCRRRSHITTISTSIIARTLAVDAQVCHQELGVALFFYRCSVHAQSSTCRRVRGCRQFTPGTFLRQCDTDIPSLRMQGWVLVVSHVASFGRIDGVIFADRCVLSWEP